MEFALTSTGVRIRAQQGIDTTCPLCSTRTIAKCGQLVIHHWAHEAKDDCDPWWEPETEWHRQWKRLLPDTRVEVTMAGHRADIVRSNGVVVELQHSPISVPEIRAREAAYGRMVWLFDGQDLTPDRLLIRPRSPHSNYFLFRWKHPRKHYGLCNQPVYIDLGDEIFRLHTLRLDRPPYWGLGDLKPRRVFVDWLLETTRFRAPVVAGLGRLLDRNNGMCQ